MGETGHVPLPRIGDRQLRDAYRIVVNRSTKETWFTPDHYVNFYKL
jgi:ribonuclease